MRRTLYVLSCGRLARSDSAAAVVGWLWWGEERPGCTLTPSHVAALPLWRRQLRASTVVVSADYGILRIIGSFACHLNRDRQTLIKTTGQSNQPTSPSEQAFPLSSQPAAEQCCRRPFYRSCVDAALCWSHCGKMHEMRRWSITAIVFHVQLTENVVIHHWL